MEGGYDNGYRSCPCFWGQEPGRLVKLLTEMVPSFQGQRVLDAGCGEGKNAMFFARTGAEVDALEISALAIKNARTLWGEPSDVNWIHQDIREFVPDKAAYNVVVAYGLFHCFRSFEEVASTVHSLQEATDSPGYHIVCAFNDRHQDLSAHPDFSPLLLKHEQYLDLYTGWQIVYASDEDLPETHPHNCIPHLHSMTRIIAGR